MASVAYHAKGNTRHKQRSLIVWRTGVCSGFMPGTTMLEFVHTLSREGHIPIDHSSIELVANTNPRAAFRTTWSPVARPLVAVDMYTLASACPGYHQRFGAQTAPCERKLMLAVAALHRHEHDLARRADTPADGAHSTTFLERQVHAGARRYVHMHTCICPRAGSNLGSSCIVERRCLHARQQH
jgi:hypothetical protein